MTTTDLPAALAGCRDAEDYFRVLGVGYDERVLAVARLHVLRLFGAELAARPAPSPPDLHDCRAALERAYRALHRDGPLQLRLFKVLQDRAPGQFIPEGDLLAEAGEPR